MYRYYGSIGDGIIVPVEAVDALGDSFFFRKTVIETKHLNEMSLTTALEFLEKQQQLIQEAAQVFSGFMFFPKTL